MVDVGTALQRVSRGDAGARMQIFDATIEDAWVLAPCVVQDERLAERVVAHAYEDIWRLAEEGVSSAMSPRAWIMTLVSSRAASMKRHRIPDLAAGVATSIADAILVARRWFAQIL